MKTYVVAGIVALVAAAACTGAKDEPKTLTSGTYVFDEVTATDGCFFLPRFGIEDGVETPFLVTTTAVVFTAPVVDIPMTLDSNDETRFAFHLLEQVDWRDNPPANRYDCVEDDLYDLQGEITGEDEALLGFTFTWTLVSGTGCNLANAPATLPCTSTGTARMRRIPPGP